MVGRSILNSIKFLFNSVCLGSIQLIFVDMHGTQNSERSHQTWLHVSVKFVTDLLAAMWEDRGLTSKLNTGNDEKRASTLTHS